jgi:hypothetical protein
MLIAQHDDRSLFTFTYCCDVTISIGRIASCKPGRPTTLGKTTVTTCSRAYPNSSPTSINAQKPERLFKRIRAARSEFPDRGKPGARSILLLARDVSENLSPFFPIMPAAKR